MGEAKRRRRLQATEWTKLFDDRPVTALISRPGKRPETANMHTSVFFKSLRSQGLPPLCFDLDCPHEVPLPPEVFLLLSPTGIVVRTGTITGMAVCAQCAAKSDAEIFTVLRRVVGRMNLGPAPTGTAGAELVWEPNFIIDELPYGMTIVGKCEEEEDEVCQLAGGFGAILRSGKLPNLIILWHGSRNCHQIVDAIHGDLKKIGADDLFEYKTGFSAKLKNDGKPIGMHSWIEGDGIVIDASGGANNKKILIMRASEYHRLFDLHDIQDFLPWRAAIEAAQNESEAMGRHA